MAAAWRVAPELDPHVTLAPPGARPARRSKTRTFLTKRTTTPATREIAPDAGSTTNATCLAARGSRLLVGGVDGRLRVFDLERPREPLINRTPRGGDGHSTAVVGCGWYPLRRPRLVGTRIAWIVRRDKSRRRRGGDVDGSAGEPRGGTGSTTAASSRPRRRAGASASGTQRRAARPAPSPSATPRRPARSLPLRRARSRRSWRRAAATAPRGSATRGRAPARRRSSTAAAPSRASRGARRTRRSRRPGRCCLRDAFVGRVCSRTSRRDFGEIAATPRRRAGYSAETSRDDAAATSWIFRGDESRSWSPD